MVTASAKDAPCSAVGSDLGLAYAADSCRPLSVRSGGGVPAAIRPRWLSLDRPSCLTPSSPAIWPPTLTAAVSRRAGVSKSVSRPCRPDRRQPRTRHQGAITLCLPHASCASNSRIHGSTLSMHRRGSATMSALLPGATPPCRHLSSSPGSLRNPEWSGVTQNASQHSVGDHGRTEPNAAAPVLFVSNHCSVEGTARLRWGWPTAWVMTFSIM